LEGRETGEGFGYCWAEGHFDGVELMRKMAADYRQQFISFVRGLWGIQVEEMRTKCSEERNNGQQDIGFEVIQGSGHHIQNDLHWEDCTGKILVFLD
jgi:hypothetical protein